MGRINYGAEIVHNLKGIIEPVKINQSDITGNWEMFPLPFDQFPKHISNTKKMINGSPIIQEAEFNLNETGDTFLDLRNFGKGLFSSTERIWEDIGVKQVRNKHSIFRSMAEKRKESYSDF
jgi:beta-galactosidase